MVSTNGSTSAMSAQRQAVTNEIAESLRAETAALLKRLGLDDLMVLNYQAKQMAGTEEASASQRGAAPRPNEAPVKPGVSTYNDLAVAELKAAPDGLSAEALGVQLYGEGDPDRAKKARSVLQYLRTKGGAMVRNGLWFGAGAMAEGARKGRGMDPESIPSLVVGAIQAAGHGLKSGEIISGIRATHAELSQIQINGAISKLVKRGKLKKQGSKGNRKYSLPLANGGAAQRGATND